MKRIEISILTATFLSALLSLCVLNTECTEIRSSVLRLHVLANSDNAFDQELKLKVRDRILALSEDIYADAGSKEEAVAATRSHLTRIQEEAACVVRENGFDYPVSVSLENCYFNTRTYGDVTLPAGDYEALQVVIGEGAGHNWWCVMFPPLCVSAAEGSAELSDVLTDEQLEMVGYEGYEVKFKCVEMYEELKKYLSGK